MESWLHAVLLGVIEGLTEFLPISSTGHLLITAQLLGFKDTIGGTFTVFIQLGAVLAVLGFYARDLSVQAQGIRHDAGTRRFWIAIVIAFLPAALAGIVLQRWIKQVLFASPTVIAVSLILGGLVFLAVERLLRRQMTTTNLTDITLRQALGIGIAQAIALIPGVSRSGASIVGGMLAGLDRTTATTFSFYLALPTLGAATLVDLLTSLDQLTLSDVGRLALGTLVAMAVAWLSIGWLLRYVARNTFVVFGIYRIIAGVIILILAAAGQLS